MPNFPAPSIGGRIVLREDRENVGGGPGVPTDLTHPFVDLEHEPVIDTLMRGVTGLNTQRIEICADGDPNPLAPDPVVLPTKGTVIERYEDIGNNIAGLLIRDYHSDTFTRLAFHDEEDPSGLVLERYQTDESVPGPGPLNTGALRLLAGDGPEFAALCCKRVAMESVAAVFAGIENNAFFVLTGLPYFRDGSGVDHNLLDGGIRPIKTVSDGYQIPDGEANGTVHELSDNAAGYALPRSANTAEGVFFDFVDISGAQAADPSTVGVHGDDVGSFEIAGNPSVTFDLNNGSMRIIKASLAWRVLFKGNSPF